MNGDNLVSIDAHLKQKVYIYKCHESVIKINGKVNAIVLDGCSKTACVFDEALASVELVNCKDTQIQCLKTAPAVSIDGCTSVSYYMSADFANAQIISAKSAALHLIRPTDDDGMYLSLYSSSSIREAFFSFLLNFFFILCSMSDIVETPIPEQFW